MDGVLQAFGLGHGVQVAGHVTTGATVNDADAAGLTGADIGQVLIKIYFGRNLLRHCRLG